MSKYSLIPPWKLTLTIYRNLSEKEIFEKIIFRTFENERKNQLNSVLKKKKLYECQVLLENFRKYFSYYFPNC